MSKMKKNCKKEWRVRFLDDKNNKSEEEYLVIIYI